MKKLLILAVVALLSSSFTMNAQNNYKQRKETRKETMAVLKEKASKDARKKAKEYEKEGWTVSPGALPIVKQLDRSYNMQYELDDEGFEKYIWGTAESVGNSVDAAKLQAMTQAKISLARNMQESVTALIKTTSANQELGPEEAASIMKTIQASENRVIQNIGRVITVIEMHKTLPNKNKVVSLTIAYSNDLAKKAVLDAVKQDLEKEGEDLHKKLDEILGR